MGTNATQEREQAHALLDLLSAEKLAAMRSLLAVMVEPLSRSLASVPVEEEEITADTAAALDRARNSMHAERPLPTRTCCASSAWTVFFDLKEENAIVITGVRHRREAYR